jgi:hypothetical protein
MSKEPNQQQLLFQQIKSKIPDSLSFVHEIAELLEISYDSAYRRIRGEKELSLDELYKLSHKFGVSIDTLFSLKTNNVVFNRVPVVPGEFNIKGWLERISKDIRIIHQAPDREIIYAAKDPPIFHYFQFPEIAAFKFFFWEKTLFDFPEYEGKKFRLDDMESDWIDIGKDILRSAIKIPTTEIWNEDTFRILLRQVEYYWVAGFFEKKDDMVNLVDKIEKWLTHMQKEADLGYKFRFEQSPEGIENYFILYENEVVLNDNTIFVRIGDNKGTYLTYNVISLLVTQDPEFCNHVERYLRGLMKKSHLISLTGLKERNRFFNKLFRTIDKTKSELEI